MPVKYNNQCAQLALRPIVFLLFTAICLTSIAAQAHERLFQAADQAASEGRLAEMLQIHEQILADDPSNVRALAGKAASLAWQRRFHEAQAEYQKLLNLEPNNVDARIGLGYAYAWDGQYSLAHTAFNQALAIDPINISARKGVALSYLWSGEYELALNALELASNIAPDDVEIWQVTGYAHLEQQNNRSAIKAFDHALQLDPNQQAVQTARMEAHRAAPAIEVFALAGSTSDAESGPRKVEISHWPARSTRVFARYDDTVGLDNPSISERGSSVHSYFAGASHRINDKYQLQVEGGVRQLTDGDLNSASVTGAFLTSLGSLTIGTQFGNHELGHNDVLAFSSLRFAVNDRWQLEPALYLSESGVDDDREWRAVLGAEYAYSDRLVFGGHLGAGQVDAAQPAFSGNTGVVGAWARQEFGGPFALTLSARYEQSPTRDFNIVELGFHYRLPGNVGGSR